MEDKKNEYINSWIQKAENDIKNIVNNLKALEEDIPTDTVCFHCQQAVEKFLKAYLIIKDKKFPSTHNLADLVSLCEEIDSSFITIKEKAEILTPFAVEIRYPDDFILPSLSETKEMFEIVKEIKVFILSKISF